MRSITSANAILLLGVDNLFPIPQKISGFATEDLFDTEVINPSEVMMGADGKMSAGLVNVPIPQNYVLQADSDSIDFFDAWYAAMKAAQDVYFSQGIIQLPSVNHAYAMNNGVLTGYTPVADAKKLLQPRKFKITWESIIAVPIL